MSEKLDTYGEVKELVKIDTSSVLPSTISINLIDLKDEQILLLRNMIDDRMAVHVTIEKIPEEQIVLVSGGEELLTGESIRCGKDGMIFRVQHKIEKT